MKPFTPKFMIPPADMAWRITTAEERGISMRTMRSAIHDNCAFISGCRSDQESADASFGGRPNGALTYYLLSTLGSNDYLKQPMIKVIPAVVEHLATNNYDQRPQLHGPDELVALPFLAGVKKSLPPEPKSKAKVAKKKKTAKPKK